MALSNSETDPAAAAAVHRKRKRTASSTSSSSSSTPLNWKSETQQDRYSTKLLAALRRVRDSTPAPRPRAVRDAADRALAVSAAGRTRWSRALLFNRSLKLNSARKRRAATSSSARRPPKAAAAAPGSERKTPELERKAKVLGRLVPGCRKLAFPTLLAEASDYIAALQMQIRAMSALTQMLAAGGDGGAAAAAPPA